MREFGSHMSSEDVVHDVARKHGLTEHEARVLQHLHAATEIYKRLPDNYDKDLDEWLAHERALARLLMVRAVKRDHPEGWLTDAEQKYQEMSEE